MKSIVAFILLLAVFTAASFSKIDDFVINQLHQKRTTNIMVNLAKQAEFNGPLFEELDKLDQSLRGWLVLEFLVNNAKETQKPIVEYLEKKHLKYEAFWVQNSIVVFGAPVEVIFELSKREDVAKIFSSDELPGPAFPKATEVPKVKTTAPEWNVQFIKAPEMWKLGFHGQNIVVGGMDTGVEATHPALKNSYRGNKNGAFDHNYNWYDGVTNFTQCGKCGCDIKEPCDDYGHGTHTVGTISGGVDREIGVAPKSKWIACRAFTNNWGAHTFLRCFQFFVAPTDLNGRNPNPDLRPHITSHSWGCTKTLPNCPTHEQMKPSVDALKAAGIMTVVAAGNEGSGCSSLRWPGIYESVWTVGALGYNSQTIAYFSSRGPVTMDGSNRRKPDVSAPGVNVTSCYPGGRYTSMSGTSMATPATAGAVALLWSAVPSLVRNIKKTEEVFQKSASHQPSKECSSPSDFPNNVYGYGTIDVFKAYKTAKELGY